MIRRSSPRPAAMLAVAALALLGLAPMTQGQTRASLPDIEDEVMCPICGTLLEGSNAPQAERERALIRKLIAEGRDKEQIKDALVAEYGENVLATPSGSGFDLVAWIVPGLAIAAAAAAIGFFAVRSLRRPSPPAVAPPSLDAPDASRLDEDMSRYDL
jgi:cytochrome c-type biogenesis protein CcmH